MKQSIEAEREARVLKPYVNGGLVDLGSFKELVHNQNLKNKFSFSYKSKFRPPTYNRDTREIHNLEVKFSFNAINKGLVPYIEKISIKIIETADEYVSFDLKLVKKSTDKSQKDDTSEEFASYESKFENYKVTGLSFSKAFLKNRLQWLIRNFDWVQKSRDKWVKQQTERTEAEMPADVKKEKDKFLKETAFYENIPDLSSFEKHLIKVFSKQVFELSGFEFMNSRLASYRYASHENNIFELRIPFMTDLSNEETMEVAGRTVFRTRHPSYRPSASKLNFGFYIGAAIGIIARNLKNSIFLGPIRSHPSRFYSSGGITPQAVGYSGESTPDLLLNDPEILKKTNKWLEKLELGYQIETKNLSDRASLFELRLWDQKNLSGKNFRVTLKDVGFGVSQVLPIIVQCIFSSYETILIEQPELHIHPRLQAELADLFIYSMTERRNRLIIETHSEHLVLRIAKQLKRREATLSKFPEEQILEFLNSDAENSLKERKMSERKKLIDEKFSEEYTPDPVDFSADKILINFVSRGKSSGSQVHQIRFTEDGKFKDKWPGGFFPERRREIIF